MWRMCVLTSHSPDENGDGIINSLSFTVALNHPYINNVKKVYKMVTMDRNAI